MSLGTRTKCPVTGRLVTDVSAAADVSLLNPDEAKNGRVDHRRRPGDTVPFGALRVPVGSALVLGGESVAHGEGHTHAAALTPRRSTEVVEALRIGITVDEECHCLRGVGRQRDASRVRNTSEVRGGVETDVVTLVYPTPGWLRAEVPDFHLANRNRLGGVGRVVICEAHLASGVDGH